MRSNLALAILAVYMQDGSSYLRQNVPALVATEFRASDSKIKGQFPSSTGP